MDIFKWLAFYFVLLLFQLCNGIPISANVPETVAYTKLLTGIISLLLTVCCLIFLAACLCCHRNRSFEKFSNTPVIASSISDFDHGHINPISSGEFTIFSPLSPPHFNNNVVQAHIESKTRTVEDPVENSYDIKFWFNQNEKDFPRSKLKYIKELGTGWFGRVVQGTAHDIDNTGQSWTPVVVRILDTTSSQKQKILFLQDAAIYRCTNHTNILSFVGRSLETVPFLLLQEYCPQGDLKGYLQSNKAEAEKLLATEYPLIWCCQLTSAVKHIHEHNIVHHDLAGRNCQLTSNLTLKLGDYGLGPFKYPSDYYQGLPTVPVRWCAPESLVCTQTTIQPKKIVPESNVWSLGITMWEICECGEQPYSGLSDDQVISQVLGPPNIRLARPIYSALYTDYIFRLMQSCWTSIESRPTASQIDTTLTDLLQVHRNTTYNTLDIEEFDRRWETSKPNTIVRTDQITDTLLTGDLHITKTLSLSLNNLHGSLDNLTEETKLSIENELKKDSLTSYRTSVSDSSEDLSTKKKKKTFNDNPLFQRTTSSGSETEEENWRCKVERGAYTEKVRQKSRSVADLMVLTHVDYSESDTETPLPSLDYRVNYKNVRLAGIEGTSNLENANLTFGSEGNLLSIQDTFQEELRKLQEERRDSLPFVPDTVSQNSFSPSRLMQELNSPVDIQPVQVFNIYNVTVDNFSPVHSKLDEIIDRKSKVMREEEDCELLNVINQSESCDIISKNDSTPDICEAVNININFSVKGEQVKLEEDNNLLINSTLVLNNVTADEYQHKLKKIEKESSIKEHSIAIVNEILESAIIKYQEASNKSMGAEIINDLIEDAILKSHHEQIVESNKIKDSIADIVDEILEAATTTQGSSKQKKEQVKKLSEIILGNEDLMQLLSTTTNRKAQTVNFDLSHDQEEAMPNSLTHSTIFTSTPFRKREISLPSEDKYSSINPFSWDDPQLEQDFSLGTTKLNDYSFEVNKKLNYSLETWDNFLGTTLDHQNQHPENLFDSFNSEPQSLLFIDNIERDSEAKSSSFGEAKENNGTFILNKTYNNADVNKTKELDQNGTFDVVKDETFKVNENRTFNVDKNEIFNIDLDTKNLAIGDSPKENKAIKSGACNEGSFENGGGWFLHPQQTDDLTGEIQIQSPHTDSYIGFGIDDEIMSAIRNELLNKLPHAQGSNSNRMKEEEEENWDAVERDQVFLRYNVYNTPLSPIPEESYVEDGRSPINSPKPEQESEEPEWSGQTDIGTLTQETESNSTLSPMRGTMNRHTPSQDSCCSNDTLFNLEELVCVTTDPEVHSNSTFVFNTVKEEISCNDSIINDFLSNERNHLLEVKKNKPNTLDINNQCEKHILLPSPEDNPWKQLPASLQNFNVTPMKALSDTEDLKPKDPQDPSVSKENLTFNKDSPDILQPPSISSDSASVENKKSVEQENFDKENLDPFYENSDTKEHIYENNTDIQDHLYENAQKMEVIKTNLYENSDVKNNDNANSDIDSYEDYVNIVNMENDRNRLKSDVHKDSYIDIYGHDEEVASEDDNIYGILTDIRFTGPSDNQMMSTSFSENNDEQGWESGSDSRSSSSGEFIWKEGEHEESLKALRAAPQDVLENIKPMEGIAEDVYEESDISSTFTDDEETPEFVPSAWDKFAIPSKSALRSPEKTQKKPEERKSKGVWFKKQKYHCIYEYPKEPDSPILQGQDLWKPQTDIRSFSDWEYDGDVYGHSQTSEETINYSNRMNNILNKQNLYQLTSITDYIPDMSTATNADGEFFISSSTQPFHPHNSSSQFFPGSSNWTFDSVTPDSGVEDITPGSITHSSEFMGTVPSLKQLAYDSVAKKKLSKLKNSEVMGGLRHTRNKLKLDLPPSPSAFTSDKPFTIEHNIEPVIREKPAFTTFGKSRFMVQHVDTPPDETKAKNVSFEALPYTPLNSIIKEPMVVEKNFEVIERSILKNEDDKCTVKVEVVRGEASLLDSGDEDSGIESTSTLERKITNS